MNMRNAFSLSAAFVTFAAATVAWAQPAVDQSAKVAPGGLYEIVQNGTNNELYVAAVGPRGETKGAIVRLDGTTLKPKGSIDVSTSPLYGLAINQTTQTLYGTDTRNGSVSAVDIATGKIIGTVQVGEKAHVRQIAVDEGSNKVYVTVVGAMRGSDTPSEIWVVDGKTNKLDRVLSVPGISLTGLALDPANKQIFSTGMTSNDVIVLDSESGAVKSRWPSGGDNAINVAFDSAGQRLFVANQGNGVLGVLNAKDGTLIKAIPTGEGALSVAYNGAVGQIYVANRRAGTLSVIDAKSYEKLADLETGTFPQTIAINRADNSVYVTNKARGLPRDAAPGTPPVDDPKGDTVTRITP
ncbi:MAG: hypothetical protein DI569_11600 [Sphingopyxis macrogoltabida]|uniref:YNCE-like beta-propeller domain-containing protein n=1 Tax=Sphingopyxis macrogoltabida TaxID=33050 RepID=A0A2W5MV27_SPHMC|nr:MAG: hypothetical protein DI569_11600 [Sphingopyxis macrogoltabida]